jgi:hypothetical protein
MSRHGSYAWRMRQEIEDRLIDLIDRRAERRREKAEIIRAKGDSHRALTRENLDPENGHKTQAQRGR